MCGRLEADHVAFIGSAPRLAEDVIRSCRLPSRHAREKTRFWRPTTRSGWAPFFYCHVSARGNACPTRPALIFTDVAISLLCLATISDMPASVVGLPSPPQVPPIRNPKKPRLPPCLGLLHYRGPSLVDDRPWRGALALFAATLPRKTCRSRRKHSTLRPPCAFVLPPGTSIRSGSGSIS